MQSTYYPEITQTTAWEGLVMWGLGIIALVLLATIIHAINTYRRYR